MATDWQLQIGSLTLGPGTDYVVSSVDGFGKPDMRNGDTARPIDDGSYFGRDFLNSRTINVVVNIAADTPELALDAHEALMAEWQLSTPDSTATKPLTFKVPGRDARRWNGRPRRCATDLSTVGAGVIKETLEYVAADPRVYSDALLELSTGMQSPGVGRSYPLTYPRTFGAIGTDGSLQITNAGTYPTRPVITFRGPCSDPTVWNDATGEFVTLGVTLTASDVVVVDFDARQMTFNGAPRWDFYASSTWWELAPGTTQVRFTADAFQAAASMSVAWRSAWLG